MKKTIISLTILFLSIGMTLSNANSEDKYWFGGTGAWEDPDNWSPYGVPELASQSPFSPKMIITDSADTSDPLNMLITAGFKVFWTALRQNPAYYVVMRSKTASTA